jgi:hypothetical protein
MKWPDGWAALIYAGEKYNHQMVVRGGKLFGFASIQVDPALALKYGRHTIKEAGIGYMLDVAIQNYRQAATDKDAVLTYLQEGTVANRPTWRFKGVFPAGRGYYGHIVYLDIDQKFVLPVKIEAYGWQGEFLEMYTYSDLKLNIGLKERDFDANNAFASGGTANNASEQRLVQVQ